MKRRRRRRATNWWVNRKQLQINCNWNKLGYGLLTIVWWGLLISLVIKVDPNIVADVGIKGAYLPFLVLLFLAVSFTLGLVRKNKFKGIVGGTLITLTFILALINMANELNLILMLGLVAAIEYYWHTGSETDEIT